MRKILLTFGFFTITPIFILFIIGLLSFYSFQKLHKNPFFLSNNITSTAYAAIPEVQAQFTGNIGTGDTRVEKLQNFLKANNSILGQYAQILVENADINNIDYKLLPAIAMQESQGCKKIIQDSYNCWGWDITHNHAKKFNSYKQAIETIYSLFAKNYIKKGYNTPELIGQFYNPANTDDWVGKVNYFISKIGNTP